MATETEISTPPRNERMIRNVREALSTLLMLREDLEDAFGMEVLELRDEYRELKAEAKQTGRPIPESWYQAVGEQIEDLCREYGYPDLLPPDWDKQPADDPPAGAVGGLVITPEGGLYAVAVVGNDLVIKPEDKPHA